MTSLPRVERPQIVGVIASRADVDRAVRMRRPPDFFELRLDRLAAVADTVEELLPKLRAPLIITARHPREGGSGNLGLRQRRDLLARFLSHASYIDVELRSAHTLRSFAGLAENKNIGRIVSFHNFQSTPSSWILAAKAREAKSYGADIFKVATRMDTPIELGRLLAFITHNRLNLALAVMGIGKLGAISRVVLARAGSVLVYASVGAMTDIEGQLSLEQLRALGIDRRRNP
ncbi:MAG TPA: type I 3-dehydroquinate dehydratase [Candidatus Udaeobacter sp.]|jgi:3-dehydroquinate dehydratase-1|nr:type I 3-dehydroquinate dehydratase [Candidatus Udaeobacter sp.]